MSESSATALADHTASPVSSPAPRTIHLGDVTSLARDYERQLRADVQQGRKVAGTVKVYMLSVTQFADYLADTGMPTNVANIARDHCDMFIDHLCQTKKPATAAQRFRAVKQFLTWLVEEGEIPANPMVNSKAPSVPDPTSDDVLSPEQIKAMVDAYKPQPKMSDVGKFIELRGKAVIMLFSATGVRLDELTQLLYNPEKLHNPKTTPHLDLDHNVIHVLGKGAGKGKRPRSINFEHETGLALSRYLRARTKLLASHGVESDALWVSGKTAKALGAHGVKDIVYTASNRSGVGHVHPHQLRHSHVDRCIRSGMQEGDIMRIHGWRNRSMLDRYARSTQSERALDSHASYGVGAY